MIHYELRCGQGHRFDGWFRNSAAFDAQVEQHAVECPICGDTGIQRALMTPSLGKRGEAAAPVTDVNLPAPATPAPSTVAATGAQIPDHVRAMLQKLRAEVEKTCEYVGPEFAAEARKIHRGESDKRGIYGETTPDQAEALADEGIEVSRIPWVPRAES